MELILRKPADYHVSQDAVEEFETAVLADPRVAPATMNPLGEAAAVAATRVLRKAGANPGRAMRRLAGPASGMRPPADYLAIMMGLDVLKCAPWFMRRARKSVYLFDAWPMWHEQISRFVESWDVRYAFVSSSQAAERLGGMSRGCTFTWLPEGVDVRQYQQRSYLERDIDVLQLGRKYDALHELIRPALAKAGRSYLYEREKAKIIFSSRADFVAGLARAKVSICVPSSITHPERAGDIETMTIRYLQSMVSKNLVVGRAPREMVDLFGYNPVVEIDMHDPAAQLLGILENYEGYVPLIEKNFDEVGRNHTWTDRWTRMATLLFPEAVQPPDEPHKS
jgi:hypothetical protein